VLEAAVQLPSVSWARGHSPAAMKQIIASKTVDFPEGITVEVKARKVRVKGPRGAPRAAARA